MQKNKESGLVTKASPFDFEKTYGTIIDRLDQNPNLKVILELDHSKNAASVDLELRPTRLILFGNPKIGTGLMQENPTAAIDLPQKIVVFENEEGQVLITYNDPFYLGKRHELSNEETLQKISKVLDSLTSLGE